MKICVLASSSSGNCTLLETKHTRVLLDVGISWTRVSASLTSIGVDPSTIDAIVISHEHTDHVAGVGPTARKLRCPVHINRETLYFTASRLQRVNESQLRETIVGQPFKVNDLEFTAFPVPHDAANPVGFVVRSNGVKVGIATDLGYPTAVVKRCLSGCNALILESNHDKDMLWNGSYPWELKQRIASRHGHLSNDQSADLLTELVHDDLVAILLSHLSEENNTAELAFSASARVLNEQKRHGVTLEIAHRDRPSCVIEID